jgi:hypothetical protein
VVIANRETYDTLVAKTQQTHPETRRTT